VNIEARPVGRVDVLQVVGPLSGGVHHKLRRAVAESMERSRQRLVIHLGEASAVDSLALGELVACLKRVREAGGDIKLVVRPDGIVHDLLQMTRLDTVFEIFGDENHAAASFSSGLS
jgi:anti-sigma B factor antagonist